uniref:SAM domain-containing protein n=1 Tax=Sipha flava TaxID=143950 RepID=A0A2S2PWY8_9HEMI
MEGNNQNNDEQNEEIYENNTLFKIQGMDLILKSINCEKYKFVFEKHGINEHTMLHLTASDLKYLNVEDKDIQAILTAVDVLNKTLNLSETQLSNDEIQKLQSSICGQLGSIVIALKHIHYLMASNSKHFNDVLIDNYLSSVDAALMVKPYLRAEEKEIEKTLKTVFKIKKIRSTISIITTVSIVCLFGLALNRFKYSFNRIPAFSNFVSQIKSWKV